MRCFATAHDTHEGGPVPPQGPSLRQKSRSPQLFCKRLKRGYVSWIEPSGKISRKQETNRKIGYKIHGHTIFRGRNWESNFENEFAIDNEVHVIVDTLKGLRPYGRTPSELIALMKLLLRKDRTLRDMCKFYNLNEQLHRNLLLLIHSLLIRSPAMRYRYEQYPKIAGLPLDENVGKANMSQNYASAKKLCQKGFMSNQYFVLLHSPLRKFLFGDGSLDWLTDGLVAGRIDGRAVVSLTPHLCVYFYTPKRMRPSPNCASLSVAPWMVDQINKITQIYSKNKLFFLGRAPKLTEAFQKDSFLEHKERADALIDLLDEIAGINEQERLFPEFTESS